MPELELALTDPSPSVQRVALEICVVRKLSACIPQAREIWASDDASLQELALPLLAQELSQEHLEILIEAMNHILPAIRIRTIELLVAATLEPDQQDRVRQAVIHRTSDISSSIQQVAIRGLATLGPGEGSLALARLLDDPDINVAAEAAGHIGHLKDLRVLPALRRAIEQPIHPRIATAAVQSLARMPGAEIEQQLLEFIDDPPRGVSSDDLIDLIGQRKHPSPNLIRGLIERLRDPNLRSMCSRTLLLIGEPALSEFEAALERGLEPNLALEVQTLLDSWTLPDVSHIEIAHTFEFPKLDDISAWRDVLHEPISVKFVERLADNPPSWLSPTLSQQIEQASSVRQIQYWLMTLVLADKALLTEPSDHIAWVKISQWAHEHHAPTGQRCLAALALAGSIFDRTSLIDSGRTAQPCRSQLCRSSWVCSIGSVSLW